MIDPRSLVGRYYTDLSPEEMAALPIGTVLADEHPSTDPLPDLVKRKNGVDLDAFTFTDGSANENWDAFEVVKSVPA